MLLRAEEKPPKCWNWYQNTPHYIHEDSDTLHCLLYLHSTTVIVKEK
jgi:hypothetical protein